MLATVIRFLLAKTFITEFMVWLSIAFVIIAGRPIRAICAEVPSVGTRFLFAPSASHVTPPIIVGTIIIALNQKMSSSMLSDRIGVATVVSEFPKGRGWNDD